MSKPEKPEAVADENLDSVQGGGVFGTPSGGWGSDGLVMGKGPNPNIIDDHDGEPVTRQIDLTTKSHG